MSSKAGQSVSTTLWDQYGLIIGLIDNPPSYILYDYDWLVEPSTSWFKTIFCTIDLGVYIVYDYIWPR